MYKFDHSGHLHTLDGKPLIGTSTAVGIISKPLTWWASGMAVKELGWTNSKDTPKAGRIETAAPFLESIKKMDVPEFLAALDKAYKAHSSNLKKAAADGTDLHAVLEEFVKARIKKLPDPPMPDKCKPFVKWADDNNITFLASEVHCYSKEMWTGGIFDVLWMDGSGRKILGDFKSSKDAYFSHFVQCAGYAIQLAENGGHNDNGGRYGEPQMVQGIAVIPFGSDDPTPRIRWDVQEHADAFRAAITLYKMQQSYGD